MDISRLKKVLAGLSVAAISLTQVGSVFAAYSDVPAGVWFEEAVDAFVDAGYLDASQPRFRGSETANRAEFVKLLVELNGGILSTPPAVPSFDDVKTSAWYYGYMEEAGKEQWVRGDGNCYGTHPCYGRPSANINRAEAAVLIVRAFGLEATGDAAQFVDNPSGQWYTQAIQIAADHCVLQGDDSTGRVRPSDNMNRAEMVVMFNRVDQGLTYGTDCGEVTPPTAPSITSASASATTKVDIEFNVDLDETTAETVARYAITGSTNTISSATLTNSKTVQLVLASGLTAGKEYTVTVTNMKTADGTTFSDSANFSGYSAIPQGNGTLEVSVSSKNPVGDSIPKGAQGVTMLSLDLTASCDDSVTLENLTLLHEGFGDKADIAGVYGSINGARVTRERSIDSKDQTAELRFITPLTVAACKTVTIDLVTDYAAAATTSAEHNLAVELASDFTSNAKQVAGNFPLKGNTFRIAAVTSGTLTIDYRAVSPSSVEVGDKGVIIGKFEVSTNATEDQTIYSMTFEQDGTVADGDITNLKLRRTDGTVLTNTVAATTSKLATFVFNPPFTVLEGDKIVLEVVGDVVGGAAKTVKMHFDEESDIFAVGSLYGYGVNGQLYGSTIALPATDNSTSLSVDAGQLTVEINGPAQQTYTRDQNDAVLANLVLTTGGETVNIKKMYVAVQANTITGGTLAQNNSTSYDGITDVLSNVTLRNTTTGRSLEGTAETAATALGSGSPTAGTYQIYRFDDFTVNGKETYQILVDFTDNGSGHSPRNGDQFKVHICGEPTQIDNATNATGCTFGGLITIATTWQMQVEGLTTADKVQDVRPRGTISGNAQRIADASLTIAVKSLATASTAVKNAKNLNLLRFEARAGEAKSILLTKAAFDSASGSLNNGANYTLWVDTDGDGTVDTILDSGESAQSSVVTFNSLTGGGFVIGKEQTVVFEVHADIAASLTNNWLQLKFATGATTLNTYLEAETVDRGSSLSGIKTNSAYPSGVTSADIVSSIVGSTRYSLVSQGDLYVTQDSTDARNRQILGGTLGEAALRLNFHAENEPIDVTSVQITSSGGLANSVEALELYKLGATSYFALATVGSCGSDDVLTVNEGTSGSRVTTFCAKMQTQQLVIPRGGDVKVLVRPRIKTDEAGATTNDPVQFFITEQAVANNATGSGAIRARGAESSNNLNANDVTDAVAEGEIFVGRASAAATNAIIVGQKSIVTLSKIASITNANPDPNGTNVPAGTRAIAQYKVTAASNSNSKNGLNQVALSGVIFNITSTNVGIASGSFVLYNTANSTVTVGCRATNTSGTLKRTPTLSGSYLVFCENIPSSSVNEDIDQGTSATYALQANVTDPDITAANTSTLQVSLQGFDSVSRTTFGATTSHFEWLDKENTSSTEYLWIESGEPYINSTSYQS